MNISVVGTGYVGLVAGACFADLGHDVICMDIDSARIEKLKKGIIPLYEPGLNDIVKRNVREGRLSFTTDMKETIQKSDVIFIAVGTPSGDDGSADMKYVESAAKEIGKYLNGYKVIVDKSTVPVGTADMVKNIIRASIVDPKLKSQFDMVSNPEFLREGEAIKDFTYPDRIVIGAESERAKNIMIDIYRGIERTGRPILITDVKSAEMIKYGSNAMLAARISFMNEFARVCEKTGADVKLVAKGIGLDSRIGSRFLQAGVGYGGSCFPKDVQGLMAFAKGVGVDLKIIKAVEEVNMEQRQHIIDKVRKLLPQMKGKKIAIWGLSFKPKTDDMREAPSITIIEALQKMGAHILAFDPEAEENAKKIHRNVEYAKTPYDAVKGCDCLVICTEWDEFRYLDKEKIRKAMASPKIVDARNVYEPEEMKKLGFEYVGVGRGM